MTDFNILSEIETAWFNSRVEDKSQIIYIDGKEKRLWPINLNIQLI